jgi:hypothetical protein
MSLIPPISPSVIAHARQVWNEAIETYGREVLLSDLDGKLTKTVRAFCKRPKILGLFDRTQASYDQERYMVMLRADDFPEDVKPEKFMRVRWNDEDHVFISVTEIDLAGVVFGYRVLVKG